MSDESTRAGGLGGYGDDSTRIGSRRVQVRMTSGKIYGPYQRAEIVAFIAAKKLSGDESILYEGTSDWKPLASDPEFFDALQTAQFESTQVKEKPWSLGSVKKGDTAPAGTPHVPEKTLVAPVPREPMGSLRSEEGIGRAAGGKTQPGFKSQIPTTPSSLPPPDMTPQGGMQLPKGVTPAGASKPLARRPRLVILGAVVALLAIVYLKDKGIGSGPASGPVLRAVTTDVLYGREISAALGRSKKAILPEIPTQIAAGTAWTLETNLTLSSFVDDLARLSEETEASVRTSAPYWGRWAWNLLWGAAIVEPWDSGLARQWRNAGEKIVDALERSKVLPDDIKALFAAIEPYTEGDWKKVTESLKAVSGNETAQWLAEDAAWWAFWEGGGAGAAPTPLRDTYAASALEAAAKVRRALIAKDSDFEDYAEDLANTNPRSPVLWFASGEYYWRLSPDQASRGNVRFLTGLGVLSGVPLSIQRVYWSQYADFLGAFGRRNTADKAVANVENVKKSRFGKDRWQDLGSEGLEVDRVVKEVLARSVGNPLSALDVASLQIFGPMLPSGLDALMAAGQHLGFENEWDRALSVYTAGAANFPQSTEAWGGVVWANASLGLFDKAFDAYDTLTKIPSETPVAQKYNAVILGLGREYDESHKEFDAYFKTVPDDAWAHLVEANLWFTEEKNVECTKSANLAQTHGQGEVKFRAWLLFMRCRILAKLKASEALQELRQAAQKNPRNASVTTELVTALLHYDLSDEAVKVSEEALKRMPRSYRLRILVGDVYRDRRDYDRAVAFYSSATKERRDSPEAWIRIAKVYEVQERPLDAATNYETAGRLAPQTPDIWLYTARAYASGRRLKEAAAFYEKELDARPAVLSSFVEMAEFMLKNNAPQVVPRIFQKYKTNYEDDPRVLLRLAQAYLAMRELDNARTAAATASARDPGLAEAYRILAIVLEMQNNFSSSKEFWQKYLDRYPQAPDAGDIRSKISRPPYAL